MEGTIYSLIPALIMLVLVLVTRKVLPSLGAGVIIGALLLHDFNIVGSLQEIWVVFRDVFITEDGVSIGNLYLFGFLILLGITTAFMAASGGSKAFGDWAIHKIKTRKGALLLPAISGLIIFIDDYFNSLAVGQVSRPVTDRFKVSRTKLAYFIDSTSAPITVISPISSWGAFIIGTLGVILADEGMSQYQPLEAFVKMIPFNMYAFAAIFLVFVIAFTNINLGAMKRHEQRALETGELYDRNKGEIPGDLKDSFASHQNGKIYHLVAPLATLIVATIGAMIVTGAQNTEGQVGILPIFENTDVNLSLFTGSLIAVIVAFVLYLAQAQPKANSLKVFWEGTRAMLPAIYILILAWMIGAVIENLETGEYLAMQVANASINPAFLPVLLFIVASFMALATGTSWGTFGIMLPIAGEIAAVTDVSLILPALSAVLAGSVFGDHCSPISDTSILSSTGAGSNHIDHVITQLPYAMIAAIASIIGYLIVGFTGQALLALIVTLGIVVIIVFALRKINPTN
ncbi:Na+/H+ antiporter NhaC family protein [Aquibacillus sediminis]|uniref:Na+/H+ antiporter NhaC family protein n=1 Tax=Aquibacillus sediminis TaxID=2574734 RepID=UPI0011092CB1|nr:Na+/H+ antiporter NhaC family protein [Aquibacillus sediminis]